VPTGEGSGIATVLVVDDEELVRTVARLTLESAGFATLEAEDGVRAVEIFREHSSYIDAVLLDLTMPILDGAETFAALRQIRDDVPVVLTSGYQDRTAARLAGSPRPPAFLDKPFTPDELIATIREVLHEKT